MKLEAENEIGGYGTASISESGHYIRLGQHEVDLWMEISVLDLLEAIDVALEGNLIEVKFKDYGEEVYLARPGANEEFWVKLPPGELVDKDK